ncbi:hypothetical protein V1477_011581, partial [Vespula maculifrons]
WGYSPTRDDNISEPTLTINGSVLLRISTSTHRITLAVRILSKLKCEVGILGFEGRQQSRSFDRLLQLLVQLCFGLRRVDLEIFADAIRANIDFAFSKELENRSPR